jgi:hypothetical protein
MEGLSYSRALDIYRKGKNMSPSPYTTYTLENKTSLEIMRNLRGIFSYLHVCLLQRIMDGSDY